MLKQENRRVQFRQNGKKGIHCQECSSFINERFAVCSAYGRMSSLPQQFEDLHQVARCGSPSESSAHAGILSSARFAIEVIAVGRGFSGGHREPLPEKS
jgi:hypothetical protein